MPLRLRAHHSFRMLLPPRLQQAVCSSRGNSGCRRPLFHVLSHQRQQYQHSSSCGICSDRKLMHTEVCSLREEGKGALSDLEAELVVVGCGQMGTGIALTAARHLKKTRVTLLDISKAQLQRGRKFSELWVHKEVVKGKLDQPTADSLLHRLSFVFLDPEILTTRDASAAPEAVRRSAFCLESASENLGVKRDIFALLDAVAPSTAVLATNTSSISITKIAAATRSPHRVIGMHFMNPVPVMPLVEIISGLDTNDDTKLRTEQLALQMKKTTAHALDRPGFVSNRLLMPYINEAVFALQEGISSAEDIDRIMRLGANMPMGPLELADFIGLDVCLAILRVLHSELGDSKYRPAPLLTQYVDAGYLGRKSGRGFYEYSNKRASMLK